MDIFGYGKVTRERFYPPQPTNPRPASLKLRAYEHIRQKLFDGNLEEGDRLSPVELGAEIGVSHIPVREVITQLASEGLVVQGARQGAFVKQMQRQELLASSAEFVGEFC